MKYKLILMLSVIFIATNIANAFSNSLDKSSDDVSGSNSLKNNFSSPTSNSFQNRAGQPFNPKEHTGFEHQDRNFPNPTMNDTRYNSNCQFGTCTPGGLNPNNK